MSWATVLQDYAVLPHPEKSLADGVHLMSDEHTLTIFDGYEKAKYHFLVMPRSPFKLENGTSLGNKELESLSTLLGQDNVKSGAALKVLDTLNETALKVEKEIKDSMMKNEGWQWDVRIGFHAVESMKHVHLHVISSDLISPKLKNKKHYNSFSPHSGFFLPLSSIINQVKSLQITRKPDSYYENILKQPLISFYDKKDYKQIPKLKEHLEREWEKLAKVEKAKARVAAKDEETERKQERASGVTLKRKAKEVEKEEGETPATRRKS